MLHVLFRSDQMIVAKIYNNWCRLERGVFCCMALDIHILH